MLRRWPHGHKAADWETSVAVTRWHLTPMPSLKDGKEPGLPRWHVALTHARGGRPGEWIMEASDDATHPLRVVAALADVAIPPAMQAAIVTHAGKWQKSEWLARRRTRRSIHLLCDTLKTGSSDLLNSRAAEQLARLTRPTLSSGPDGILVYGLLARYRAADRYGGQR